MTQRLQIAAIGGAMLAILCCGPPAIAQKSGEVLKVSFFDNPASMSVHEEATGAALRPMMGVFNNHVPGGNEPCRFWEMTFRRADNRKRKSGHDRRRDQRPYL